MPTLGRTEDTWIDPERASFEVCEDRFDRGAFARRALELIGTPHTTVAICEGARSLRVESGRLWGRQPPERRWAVLAISPNSSRRAIALAVAELARVPRAYALDLLLYESRDS
jgi:hypothetical protein